jgi:Uma2 family endonuclease
MTIAQETHHYSPEEYLDLEVNSDIRHEYINGVIIPMTGGTPNHNQIALNFSGTLNFLLKRQPYRVFVTDQRLWIPDKCIHTYPDIMVIQNPLVYEEGRKDTLTNPVMIAEVLSKSTSSNDRDQKFAAYRTIHTLEEYILIEQYWKTDNNKWIFSEFTDENTSLNLASVSCQILLADIYDKVDFNT